MESIVFIVLGLVAGIFIGYKFCMIRWRPKEMIELSKIQSQILSGEIGAIEGLEKVREIEKSLNT